MKKIVLFLLSITSLLAKTDSRIIRGTICPTQGADRMRAVSGSGFTTEGNKITFQNPFSNTPTIIIKSSYGSEQLGGSSMHPAACCYPITYAATPQSFNILSVCRAQDGKSISAPQTRIKLNFIAIGN